MYKKLMSVIAIVILSVGLFAVFSSVVDAKGLNFFCNKSVKIVVSLKNDADIELSKKELLKIPNVKITNIQYRDKEWSRMVNKMDLPKMENPFKNEITIKTKKNTDINEIYKIIKDMDFVENVKYDSK